MVVSNEFGIELYGSEKLFWNVGLTYTLTLWFAPVEEVWERSNSGAQAPFHFGQSLVKVML